MTNTRTSYIPKFLALFCVTFALFSGCSFGAGGTPEPALGTITVNISLDENFSWGDSAVRQIFGKTGDISDAERSAMPSGFPTTDATKLVFAGAVHADTDAVTTGMLWESEYSYDSSTKKSTVKVPFLISATDRTSGHSLTIYAFPHGTTISSSTSLDTALLVGSAEISIPVESYTATLQEDSIMMYPNSANATSKGLVNLFIVIPSKYYLATDNPSLAATRADTAVGDTIKYTISTTSGDGVLTSSLGATFSLLEDGDDLSSTVFAWAESINVFPGLTTDKWDDNSIGTLSDDGTTRTITDITIYSTFYVRGEPESGKDSWFAAFESEAASDDNNGSLMKPYSTVQKAIDRIIGTGSGTGINDGETSYTIFVDGTVQNSDSNKSIVADFSSLDTNKATISIIGLGTDKATLKGRDSSCPQFDSVISIPSYVSQLDLTLRNLKITGGATGSNGGGISNAGGSKITIEDCEISGNIAIANGGGIYNVSGTVTLTNCTITGNTADANGGGIYNDGTITFKDCTIENNTASKGVGMHNSGTVMISGAVKFATTDDIYLVESSYITIAGTLSESTVARITTAVSLNKQILGVDDVKVTNMTYNICKKFLLSNENETEPLEDYIIYPDSTEKKGVIAHPSANVPIKLPVGEYTFELLKNGKELKNNSATTDDELTFKVYDSANAEVTNAAKYKIALKQNGDEIAELKAESTNANTAKVTIPKKLVDTDGTVDVVVSATINGVTYDMSVVGFRMTRFKDVETADLLEYLKTHTGQMQISVQVDKAADISTIKNALRDSSVTVTGVDLELTGGVTSIDSSAFDGCRSLTSIEIPSSVTSIAANAFYGCSSLTSVIVDNGNPNYASENGILFNKDKTILVYYPFGKIETSYSIPSSVTSIDNSAFDGCRSLTSIEIPSSVASIGYYAFYGCSSLASITIPSSVTSIGWYAFSSCSSLDSVTILATTPPSFGDYAFTDNKSTRKIYVPAGSVDAYKTASGWSDYADSIFAIP